MFTSLALWALIGMSSPPATSPLVPQREPIAVLELFTSEGCSSCPAADDLLAKLAGEPSKGSGRVICAGVRTANADNHLLPR